VFLIGGYDGKGVKRRGPIAELEREAEWPRGDSVVWTGE